MGTNPLSRAWQHRVSEEDSTHQLSIILKCNGASSYKAYYVMMMAPPKGGRYSNGHFCTHHST